MRRALWSILTVTTWLLAGCTAPQVEATDPLASLASPEPSSSFTEAYWTAQAQDTTETWRQAVELCGRDGHRQLPNCETVGRVRFLRTLREAAERTSKPYDGQGGVPFPDLMVRTLETGTDPLPSEASRQGSGEE